MRTFLLILMMTLGMSLNARTWHLQSTQIAVVSGAEHLTQKCDVQIILDGTDKRCIIDSRETQIFDYQETYSYETKDGFTVIECVATDTHYNKMALVFYFNSEIETIIISIVYNDITYSYFCYMLD